MYLCVVLDFDKHMGVDHQPPRQLKFSVGQGVNRLDAVLGVVTPHKELEPDIRALIKISLPSRIESLEVCLLLHNMLIAVDHDIKVGGPESSRIMRMARELNIDMIGKGILCLPRDIRKYTGATHRVERAGGIVVWVVKIRNPLF